MALTHGGLFEGYGGTTMAARLALGDLDTRWVSDVKPASIALLRHRHPGVPNLGDMKLINYRRVEPVDVLTASWPCQPHSSAGKRLGEADPRALWPFVAHAIAELRPAIFLGENVARITSNGELRRVVCSLAALGYVGAWRVQRASDVYGCHQRARCFIVAIDATAPHTLEIGLGTRVNDVPAGEPNAARGGHLTLLPTPTQSMTTGAGTSGRDGGLNLQTAVSLLPTPTATDGRAGVRSEPQVPMSLREVVTLPQGQWGVYAEAIARWGCAFDREAPVPTQPTGRGGKPQLSPHFVEWMMGLPAGWVCGVPDLAPGRPAKRRAVAARRRRHAAAGRGRVRVPAQPPRRAPDRGGGGVIRTVIGADPGLTTGLARIDLDDWREPVLDQVAPGDVLPAVEALIGAQDPTEVLLAVEQFVVGPRASRSSTPQGGRVARELINALQFEFLDRGVRVVLRSASQVKPWATDARLRAAGLYLPGKPHARDASRHALFAAVSDCGLPDPLSNRYRPLAPPTGA